MWIDDLRPTLKHLKDCEVGELLVTVGNLGVFTGLGSHNAVILEGRCTVIVVEAQYPNINGIRFGQVLSPIGPVYLRNDLYVFEK